MATPGLVRNVYWASAREALGVNTFVLTMDDSLASNCLILNFSAVTGAAVSSITDNQGNTWTLVTSRDSGVGGITTFLYYAAGAAAGTNKITIVFTAGQTDFHAELSEFYNIKTTVPAIDGSIASMGTAPTVSSGTFATTINGNLIYACAMNLTEGSSTFGVGSAPTAIAAGSGYTLLAADLRLCGMSEYQIQTTSSGTTSASFTVTQPVNDDHNIIVVAFQSAAAGTAPPAGIRIVHEYHLEVNIAARIFAFPCTGNLLVLAVDDANNDTNGNIVTSVTSSPSNTWTKVAPLSNNPQLFYVANASTATTLTGTINNNTPAHTTMARLYDISGAATSPHDVDATANGTVAAATTTTQARVAGDTTVTIAAAAGIANNDFLMWELEIVKVTAGGGTTTLTILRAQRGTTAASHASGTNLIQTNLTSAPSITPTTANGLVFGIIAFGVGPIDGTVGAAFVCDNAPYQGETDAGKMNNGDAWSHTYNSAASAQSFGYQLKNGSSLTTWFALAVAFKAAAVTIVDDSDFKIPMVAPRDDTVSVW
jgi:hypothetical protein